MKHEDACTLLRNGGDEQDILTRKLFSVNMRLFEDNPLYRRLVIRCALYIQMLATTEREGYKTPHGFSGANAGIPWNIIALRDGTIMINPWITDSSITTKVSESNCGSLLLPQPIPVRRHTHIRVEYIDLDSKVHHVEGYLPTVQHEIDHNLGILITDPRRMVNP